MSPSAADGQAETRSTPSKPAYLVPLVTVEPEYPAAAANQGVEGWVELQFSIDRQGRVKNPKAIKSSPNDIFNLSALRAIRKWRYEPRVENGKTLETQGVMVRMRFELEAEGEDRAAGPAGLQKERFTAGKGPYAKLVKAYRAIEEKRYDQAIAQLDEIKKSKSLSSRERAKIWQLYGYAWVSLEAYEKATWALKKSLAMNALSTNEKLNVLFILGQIHLAQKDYRGAIRQFEKWLDVKEQPSGVSCYIIATAYYQGKRYRRALHYAYKAVSSVEDPPKHWTFLVAELERIRDRDIRLGNSRP